jgi:hypothetical protein
MVAGAVTVALGAVVDRLLYELTGRADDLGPMFLFAATKRTLTTAGGVLVAFGVATEIIRRHPLRSE